MNELNVSVSHGYYWLAEIRRVDSSACSLRGVSQVARFKGLSKELGVCVCWLHCHLKHRRVNAGLGPR